MYGLSDGSSMTHRSDVMNEEDVSGFDVLFTPDVLSTLRRHAEREGVSISEFIADAVLRALEDAEDAIRADAAYQEYLEGPVSYSLDEVFGDRQG